MLFSFNRINSLITIKKILSRYVILKCYIDNQLDLLRNEIQLLQQFAWYCKQCQSMVGSFKQFCTVVVVYLSVGLIEGAQTIN